MIYNNNCNLIAVTPRTLPTLRGRYEPSYHLSSRVKFAKHIKSDNLLLIARATYDLSRGASTL
jgi:hypothetical protein